MWDESRTCFPELEANCHSRGVSLWGPWLFGKFCVETIDTGLLLLPVLRTLLFPGKGVLGTGQFVFLGPQSIP